MKRTVSILGEVIVAVENLINKLFHQKMNFTSYIAHKYETK